jgi:hypothetical protein
MTTRYEVWSTHAGPRPERDEKPPAGPVEPARDVLEVSRTDFKVAQEDAAIFREIFHRKSWVNDTQEGRK